MNCSRLLCLATICAAIMCIAGTIQLLGSNRIVVDEGRRDASTSPPAVTTLAGGVDVHFKTDTVRLDP